MESFFVLLLVLVDVTLWTVGTLGRMSPADRFRMRALATILLFPILGYLFGWVWGPVLFFLGVWIAAIVVARVDPETTG